MDVFSIKKANKSDSHYFVRLSDESSYLTFDLIARIAKAM